MSTSVSASSFPAQFAFSSSESAVRGLHLNLRHLASLRQHLVAASTLADPSSSLASSPAGPQGFEALCHGVASSLQEISLRLVRLTEEGSDAQLRDDVLECRKELLDAASAIVLHSRQPHRALPHLDALTAVCGAALEVSERHAKQTVARAAAPALHALDVLERSAGYADLFRNIKHFGSRLHSFLELSSHRCHDLRSERAKGCVVARAETVRKLLPVVIQSLRESLKHPMNSHARSNRAYFFKIVRDSIVGISDTFAQAGGVDVAEESVGQFVRTLDFVLDTCEGDFVVPGAAVDAGGVGAGVLDDARMTELSDKVEWMVRFCLGVAKVSPDSENTEIVANCHSVVREADHLKEEVEKACSADDDETMRRQREVNVARDILRDAVEELEQNLNNALLKLIIELFCQANSPLDELIHGILNSPVSPPDRRPEDVDESVSAFDDWSDLLFHVAHFSTFCTNDRKRSREIESALAFMQELEAELIPACLKLYFNPEDHGARSHLRSVRSLWMQELESLESNILGIVDSTAFCYVIHEESKSLAGAIKRQQYSQDRAWVHRQGAKLVRMCQRAVDFAWKDVVSDGGGGRGGEAMLPDDHPIVKVERSTWEVQGALRLVLANIEDLNLHKTMIRRVQVLVTCLGIMARFLVGRGDISTAAGGTASASKVRVLTSVTRITIGHDAKMTVTADGGGGQQTSVVVRNGGGASVSRSKAMSFRSVQRKESILKRRREGDDETLAERKRFDESIAKLALEAETSCFPFRTRKTAANQTAATERTPAQARKSPAAAFGFTEIFDELSALSRDISHALEESADEEGVAGAAGELEEGVEPLPRDEEQQQGKPAPKDVSLRKLAFKNAAAAGGAGELHLVSAPREEGGGELAAARKKRASGGAPAGGGGGGGGGSSRSSPASNEGGAGGDFVGLSLVHSPERLRDIKSLDAKLAAIKSDLEGTEAS